jgi:FtsZ-binding cell division protein ZapB
MGAQLLGIARHSRQQECAAPQELDTHQWLKSQVAQLSQQVVASQGSFQELSARVQHLHDNQAISQDEIRALRASISETSQSSQVCCFFWHTAARHEQKSSRKLCTRN